MVYFPEWVLFRCIFPLKSMPRTKLLHNYIFKQHNHLNSRKYNQRSRLRRQFDIVHQKKGEWVFAFFRDSAAFGRADTAGGALSGCGLRPVLPRRAALRILWMII
jgi:hypothetical protein